jgi:hypothetical protein
VRSNRYESRELTCLHGMAFDFPCSPFREIYLLGCEGFLDLSRLRMLGLSIADLEPCRYLLFGARCSAAPVLKVAKHHQGRR